MQTLTTRDFEALALDVRRRLRPDLAVTELVPLEVLVRPHLFEGPHGPVRVVVAPNDRLPFHVYGLTTIERRPEARARIWLNREAWPELTARVPRTRFTVAHELGHALMHGPELDGLDERPEDDHHDRLEREANRLAAHLLVPDTALDLLGSRGLEEVARRFSVSTLAAARRMDEWKMR